jgi:hypothetical protein
MMSRNQNATQGTVRCSMLFAAGSDPLSTIAPAAPAAGVTAAFAGRPA